MNEPEPSQNLLRDLVPSDTVGCGEQDRIREREVYAKLGVHSRTAAVARAGPL